MFTKDKLVLMCKGQSFRLVILAGLVLPLSAWASSQLYLIFQPNGIRPLEWVQLVFAVLLFLWLSVAFWTSVLGFVLNLLKLDPLTLRVNQGQANPPESLRERHAVIMPIYNEDTMRIMAGFEACVMALAKTKCIDNFDFYMLSDTQEQSKVEAEPKAWAQLLSRLPSNLRGRCYYRRRENNLERKVGNVKDFFENWGHQYCGVIVLDADSIMAGSTMLDLAARLEQNPKVGLIQTIPMPVRQSSFFARYTQFAASLYSPMLATGLNFWQGNCANYWGHNAIIRSQAFLTSCGLPSIPGKKPFGGDILSHDFVEAALLRRNGWEVYLSLDKQGSYEEVPSNVIDYATRDRRWVQGNMQHLGLLNVKGLKTTNKLHFVFGAFAYLSSICLMIILAAGSADAVLKSLTDPVYFPNIYQLFPSWVITPEALMITTLYVTLGLLFLPKLIGVFLAILTRHQEFGGRVNLLKSALVEFTFALLIAPVMLLFHSYFVVNVLAGKSVGWEAQAREGKMVAWRDAVKIGWIPSLIGISWSAITVFFTPNLVLWLLPVLVGMVLTIPLIRYTSSDQVGLWLKTKGIFLIQQEKQPDPCIKHVSRAMRHLPLQGVNEKLEMPTIPSVKNPRQMQIQALFSEEGPSKQGVKV